jgi:ribosomal protein L37AE/L43A
MSSQPKTLTEAIRYYSDAQTCINAVAQMRWQDGSPVCPKCNAAQGERNHYWLATQKRWKCYSCLKRTLNGTYVAVEPYHMDRYLDEQMFRFNNRIGYNDGTRFQKALSQVAGKRLTWLELTGKQSSKVA